MAIPSHPAKVLIADDEHLVASGMVAALDDLGFEVVGPAGDGAHAIELCKSQQPDMALLDIRMPGTDGLEAAKVIFGDLGVPVMMLSAYSDPEYVSMGSDIGVFGYLLKPVSRDQLRVGIEVAWSRWLAHLEQDGKIDDLKERLEQRKIIEQAKWIIVKRKGVDEPDAMRMLQKQSRNSRKSLIDVAQSVVDSDSLLGE
ncbi:MAG: response regulator [Phycisphaerales bacterium]|nr:response regulator [Phycisphaerales bacterium]